VAAGDISLSAKPFSAQLSHWLRSVAEPSIWEAFMDPIERSRLARVVTWLIVGVIVVLLVRVLFALLRVTIGIAAFLFLTVVPLIVLGWIAMKLWDRYERGREPRP
jgi:archaellum biogenesis protein FlaJ (TadC family)